MFYRHLQKVVHSTVWVHSAQLTDDKSDDESEQPSRKRTHTMDQECADDIYFILFGDDQIDTAASRSSSRGKKSKTFICQIHWYKKDQIC